MCVNVVRGSPQDARRWRAEETDCYICAAVTERAGEIPARGCVRTYMVRVRPPGEGVTQRTGGEGVDWIRAATGMRTGRRGWDKTLFLQISPQSPRVQNPSCRRVHGTASHSLSAITGTRSLTPLSRSLASLTPVEYSCNTRPRRVHSIRYNNCIHHSLLVFYSHNIVRRCK